MSEQPVRHRAATGDGGRTRDLTRPAAPDPLAVPVVDTHCHLDIGDGDDGATWLTVEEALGQAVAVGVSRIVQVGCDLPSARWSVQTAVAYDDIVATVALHPNEAWRIQSEQGPDALAAAYEEIAGLVTHERVRGVGETGLDHYRTGPEGRAVQEESFRRHIRWARETGKALTIHDREAHEDVLRVLAEEGAPPTVVFHCFSGDADMARYCTDRGWYLSFAGVVTFKNAQGLRDALAVTPLDRVLVETDAPFLTPVPYRGRPNASYLVPLTVRAMAEVTGVGEEAMSRHLWDNAERVFGPL